MRLRDSGEEGVNQVPSGGRADFGKPTAREISDPENDDPAVIARAAIAMRIE